jgi:hypothetical protein
MRWGMSPWIPELIDACFCSVYDVIEVEFPDIRTVILSGIKVCCDRNGCPVTEDIFYKPECPGYG